MLDIILFCLQLKLVNLIQQLIIRVTIQIQDNNYNSLTVTHKFIKAICHKIKIFFKMEKEKVFICLIQIYNKISALTPIRIHFLSKTMTTL